MYKISRVAPIFPPGDGLCKGLSGRSSRDSVATDHAAARTLNSAFIDLRPVAARPVV